MKLRIITGRWEKRLLDYVYIVVGSFLGIAIIGLLFYIIVLDQVVLNVDGQTFRWQTLSSNVADVLREKGVELKQGDEVQPELKTAVTEKLVINVVRSFPVTIKAEGKTTEVYTTARPVKEVLNEAGIDFDDDDKVTPRQDVIVEPKMKIKVVKVTSSIITKKVTLNPGTEYRKDKNLERGQEKIVQQGAPGLAERQIKVIYEDGRVISSHRITDKVIKEPVNKVVARGIKKVIRTLETSRGNYRYVEVKTMKATAYYPGPESCGKYAVYGETYTGKKAGFGLVAVDPRVIKLGTKLYIEGYGYAEAADIGGAIKGNKIDLCFETYREAAMYGVKKIKVYILE